MNKTRRTTAQTSNVTAVHYYCEMCHTPRPYEGLVECKSKLKFYLNLLEWIQKRINNNTDKMFIGIFDECVKWAEACLLPSFMRWVKVTQDRYRKEHLTSREM